MGYAHHPAIFYCGKTGAVIVIFKKDTSVINQYFLTVSLLLAGIAGLKAQTVSAENKTSNKRYEVAAYYFPKLSPG